MFIHLSKDTENKKALSLSKPKILTEPYFSVEVLAHLWLVEHFEEQSPLLVRAWSNRMPSDVRAVSSRANFRVNVSQELSTPRYWISMGFVPPFYHRKYC
jgi:hypothetical protein